MSEALPDPGAGLLAARLTLARWLSPAFPLGSFAYSHGLEAAMAQGLVTSAEEVGDWVADVIRFGSGRVDAALLAHALVPGADHGALADLALALAAGRERAAETMEQGAALTRTLNGVMGRDDPAAPLPVALGRAAAGLGLPAEEVIAQYLQAFATALVQAAVRFLPLGQTEGQAALWRLGPVIAAAARQAAEMQPDDMGSGAFGSDLAALRHETLDVRIFRT